jgi:hypothetical protein
LLLIPPGVLGSLWEAGSLERSREGHIFKVPFSSRAESLFLKLCLPHPSTAPSLQIVPFSKAAPQSWTDTAFADKHQGKKVVGTLRRGAIRPECGSFLKKRAGHSLLVYGEMEFKAKP